MTFFKQAAFWALCICSSYTVGALNVTEFYEVKVKSGDGITTLLQRYKLEGHSCNIKKFCELNNLEFKDHLFTHKVYKMPLLVMNYNGKNIRTSIGVEDLELAKRIKSYNENLQKLGLRKSSFTTDKKIFVPYHELDCGGLLSEPSEKKSSKPKPLVKIEKNGEEKSKKGDGETIKKIDKEKEVKVILKDANAIVNPLFGPKYERVEFEDKSLYNQIFYIISGHGGPDPGALCSHTEVDMCEDEYAYDVALRLARDLTQHGATVHMIVQDGNDGIRDEPFLECDHDEAMCTGCKIPLGQLTRLKIRTDAVNKLYAQYKKKKVKSQRLIEIHVDSRSEEHRQDVFFYHYNGVESEKIANNLHSVFQSKYQVHQKDRGYFGHVSKRGLYTLRKAKPASVYIELANIKNSEDHKRLTLNTNRQALANWLFEGLIK